MSREISIRNIDYLRSRVIDFALLSFSFFGVANIILIIINSAQGEFNKPIDLWARVMATALFLGLTFFRKRFSVLQKAATMFIIITFVAAATFYGLGLLSNAKVYITVFPLLILMLVDLKRALYVLMVFVIIYAVSGYLYYTGVIKLSIDVTGYNKSGLSWVIGIMVLIYSALGMLLAGSYISSQIISNTAIIEQQNKKLAEKEDKFRAIFENSIDGIFLIRNNQIFDCNEATIKIFGYPRHLFIGNSPWQISPPFQPDGTSSFQIVRFFLSKALIGEPQLFELKLVKYNGDIFDAWISLSLIDLGDDSYLQAIVRDISERKRTETELLDYQHNLEDLVDRHTRELHYANEEMEAMNEEMMVANEQLIAQSENLKEVLEKLTTAQKQLVQTEKMASIGVLTSGIAHEINNPVNFISSGIIGLEMELAELLQSINKLRQECYPKLSPEQQALVETVFTDRNLDEALYNIPALLNAIRAGIEQTTGVIKSIRMFSRMEDTEMYPASISEIIDSVLVLLRNKYTNHITIRKEYCSNDMLMCFPGKLGQLFMNLVLNAIDAIENEGEITITTQFHEPEQRFIVSVADTGRGIPAELHQQIFLPFFTTRKNSHGPGLGLPISLSIAQEHHGDIQVVSEEGKGANFIVFLSKL